MKFKVGDICICNISVRTNEGGGKSTYHRDCKMRITSLGKNGVSYRVWNIDLERYEVIGESFLSLCPIETRDRKINQILE
jgi:hypothetical protein